MITASSLVLAASVVAERVKPVTALPHVKGWEWRSRFFVALEFVAVVVTFLLCAAIHDLSGIGSLFELRDESLAIQVSVNFLLSTLAFYWWHRVRHDNDFLWRAAHQFHHSPRRIETITAFYKHPIEVILDTCLNFALSFLLLGVSVEAFLAHTACIACSQFFVHMNVATPRWVGYFVQRPEMHRIHHEFGVHKNNYADLPLWDILFGTFRNPARVKLDCGFTSDQEARVLDMLTCKDIHK
jgi:sterol desaturase/sphingolipid hydroxylase (fatty acid hydroxylase superfamily)